MGKLIEEIEEMGEFFNRRANGYEAHMNEIAQVACIDLSEKMLALLAEHYQGHITQLEIICD